ncbi:MAG TPA: hypothetical protein VJ327_06310 [Patescibacteria group bacterium]|nr:hypothetical protein [Patescibacteria group bacterium]
MWHTSNGVPIVFEFELRELEGDEKYLSPKDKELLMEKVEEYLANHPNLHEVTLVVFGNWQVVGIKEPLELLDNVDSLIFGHIQMALAPDEDDCLNCWKFDCPFRAKFIFPPELVYGG